MSEIIVLKKDTKAAILEDVVSFGVMLGSLYISHTYLGDHWYLNIFIIFSIFMVVVSKANKSIKRFTKKETAIKYIKESK